MKKERVNPFERGGANYVQNRPTYPLSLLNFLVDQCDQHEKALDVGCGNGQLSCLLATRFHKVFATDPSAEQISNAIPGKGVIYHCEAAERIRIDTLDVDLVVAAQAAHWFNLEKFYTEVSRISRSGTILALICYGVPEIEGKIGETFHNFYWGEIHDHWPEERKHVESGYSDIYFPFKELVMPTFAIEKQWTLFELCGYIDTWSAVQAAVDKNKVAIINSFKNILAKKWGCPTTQHLVKWPLYGKVTRY
ncbi:MAG: class I SAM-dependent methyltransferase [Methyloligellaceae bacterium]